MCCKDTLFQMNSHHLNALFQTNIIYFNAFFQTNVSNSLLNDLVWHAFDTPLRNVTQYLIPLRIKKYFNIHSNEILKRDLPNWTGPSHYCKSDNYSSTAACAAANGNWLSAHYGESGKHLGNIMSMNCTFCTRFPQNIRPFLPLRLLVSIFLLLNTNC